MKKRKPHLLSIVKNIACLSMVESFFLLLPPSNSNATQPPQVPPCFTETSVTSAWEGVEVVHAIGPSGGFLLRYLKKENMGQGWCPFGKNRFGPEYIGIILYTIYQLPLLELGVCE